MSDNSSIEPVEPGYANYQQLREAELVKIAERRKNACQSGTADDSSADPKIGSDLIGLALSGGGIRSAVFNLGVLQALSHRGFLRYVDYLSSVSGGGYIAGHVSALAHSVSKIDCTSEADSVPRPDCEKQGFHDVTVKTHDLNASRPSANERVADLGVDANGRLTSSYRFSNVGNYLFSDVAGMAWRYILFTSVTVLQIVSLVGVLAALAALIWRLFDSEIILDILLFTGIPELGTELNVGDETLTAFLPTIILFLVLVVCAVVVTIIPAVCALVDISFGRFSPERWESQRYRWNSWCNWLCSGLLRCWGISLIISTAVFLGNGETSFTTFTTAQSIDSLTKWQDKWIWPLSVMMILSLLPLLRFRSLVNSTRPEEPVWKGYLATALMSFTCVAGPFLMVFWMARENVSGFATHRDPEILRNDIQDWSSFGDLCNSLECGKEVDSEVAAAQKKVKELAEDLYSEQLLGQKTWLAHENLPHHSINGLMKRFVWVRQFIFSQHNVSERLLFRPNSSSTPEVVQNPVRTYLRIINKQREHQENATTLFNKELADPKITIKLVSIACRQSGSATFTNEHRRSLIWHKTDGTPAKVGELLSQVSRESDNLKTYWRRALLDSMDLTENPPVTASAFLAFELGTWMPASVASLNRLLLESLFPDVSRPLTMDLTKQPQGPVADFLAPKLKTWTPHNIKSFNRLLLESLFPDVIRPRTMVSTLVVPEKDQECRLQWLMVWLCLSVALSFIDWNSISPLFVYYRNKLSRSFVQSAAPFPSNSAEEKPKLRLTDLKPWTTGAPFPLMVASMHFFRSVANTPSVRKTIDPPDASRCQPFVMTPLHCGSAFTGWSPTQAYCGGQITVADAAALSGAAVTPFMVSNLGITALMAMANLRIGKWLPLPGRESAQVCSSWARRVCNSWASRSGWATCFRLTTWLWWATWFWWVCWLPFGCGLRVGWELVRGLFSSWREESPAEYLSKCQVALAADGGFHEFFGLEELLLRRCRLIVVVDAGCNNGRYEFGALADVLRMMRMQHGIEFLDLDHETPIEIGWLKRNELTSQQPLHHCCFRARYPKTFDPAPEGPREAIVVYAQMSLTGDEDLDLQQFRNINPNFPDEPTTNQRYSADQVESYRQLGFHIGETICQAAPKAPKGHIAATEWSNYFCEGYVRDWRRLVKSPSPTVDYSCDNNLSFSRDQYSLAEKAVERYFEDLSVRRMWDAAAIEWIRHSKRPSNVSPLPLPGQSGLSFASIGELVFLILACQARTRTGADMMGDLIFQPGGRARLCQYACNIWLEVINKLHVFNPTQQPDSSQTFLRSRQKILRDLRNVAFAPAGVPIAPEKVSQQSSSASEEASDLGCRLAAALIVMWNYDSLPVSRIIEDDVLIVTEDEIGELEYSTQKDFDFVLPKA